MSTTQILSTIELESLEPHSSVGASKTPSPALAHTASSAAESRSIRSSSLNVPNAQTSASTQLTRGRAILVIAQLCLVTIICSIMTGIITIAIPRMAADLSIPDSLVFWPVLIWSLTAGSFVLLAGSVADVIGSKLVNLIGVFFLGVFALAMGFARNGSQLIAFRALGGVALSLFLPTSVALISNNISSGRLRNSGFSFLGVGQVIGYASGLVLGGVFVNTVGWRVGYYMCGGALLALFALGLWALPADRRIMDEDSTPRFERLKTEIDWIGVTMSSTALALLAYVLAQISSSTSSIHKGYIATLLALSLTLMPACAVWFGYQERRNKPALIPNSIWKKLPFTTMCIMIMFVYAEMGTMEFLASLFFQQVQGLKAIDASLRILPSLTVGLFLNFTTGLFIHRLPANHLLLTTTAISAASPLIMANINPAWTYWRAAFPAQLLFPLAVDVLFTVALLVVSDVFPEKDQALAGAVFNTIGQFGQSLGLALVGVLSNTVTHEVEEEGNATMGTAKALMAGYRASFWMAFAWMVLVCVIAAGGLRRVGKVGVKRD